MVLSVIACDGVIECSCLTRGACPPGELDHLPEVAFYMVGPIEEVVIKADRLAKERADAA